MIINTDTADHRELVAKATGEKLSLSATFAENVGFKNLIVHHEILPAGRKLHSKHSHTHKEEAIFMLEGTLTIELDGRLLEAKQGDLVPIAAGQTHTATNQTDTDCMLLKITTNPAQDEVVYQ